MGWWNSHYLCCVPLFNLHEAFTDVVRAWPQGAVSFLLTVNCQIGDWHHLLPLDGRTGGMFVQRLLICRDLCWS